MSAVERVDLLGPRRVLDPAQLLHPVLVPGTAGAASPLRISRRSPTGAAAVLACAGPLALRVDDVDHLGVAEVAEPEPEVQRRAHHAHHVGAGQRRPAGPGERQRVLRAAAHRVPCRWRTPGTCSASAASRSAATASPV